MESSPEVSSVEPTVPYYHVKSSSPAPPKTEPYYKVKAPSPAPPKTDTYSISRVRSESPQAQVRVPNEVDQTYDPADEVLAKETPSPYSELHYEDETDDSSMVSSDEEIVEDTLAATEEMVDMSIA